MTSPPWSASICRASWPTTSTRWPSALRWLRAEYRTKTEARQDLGVRSIIEDTQVYDYLKLFAAFVRLAGFAGLLVNVDEMGVLSHRLNNSQARNANYEAILRIVNDCLQGNVAGIGFLFGGTDSFLEDRRRGLASYEALATRLAANAFARDGLKDFSGPVIRLQNLSPEDLFVLLHNIRNVFALGDPSKYLVNEEAMKAFMDHCARTARGRLLPDPARRGQGVRRPALGARAESGGRRARPAGRHDGRARGRPGIAARPRRPRRGIARPGDGRGR